MSLENLILPGPPKFIGSNITIPPFFHCNHPYTKWMLNMLRGGASFRIITMIKERPELFQQIYQIPDWPDIVRNESHDTISMFNRHTILFLNPLCLAIYMKKEKSAELILKSGLNNSNQNCWASEVFSRSQSGRGDLLEIYPICIAIRREYFEVIPILIHCEPRNGSYSANFTKLNVTERIEIRYENCEGKKIFRYKDALQYAIDTLKRRGNLPLSRLLELFILDCPNLFSPYKLDEDKNGNVCSLFFRIARMAFFNDPDCRICMQFIQCLEILLKHRCVPWNNLLSYFKSSQHYLNDSLRKDNELNILAKDHYSCIGFLLALYNQIQKRVKNGPLDNLGYLIIKALQQTQLIGEFVKMTPEQIQLKFGMIRSDIVVPLETTRFVKRHVQAIIELEKEREFKSNIFSRTKSSNFMNRYHRRSCSLVEQSEHSSNQVLLQSRITNNNTVVPEFNCSQLLMKPLKNPYDPIRSEELVPLYIYQAGTNSCETQTNSDSLQQIKRLLPAHEEISQSPIHSEMCEKIEIIKHSLAPELYGKDFVHSDENRHQTNENSNPHYYSDRSELNDDANCLKSCRYPPYSEQSDRNQILKNHLIPGICKNNYAGRNEVNGQSFRNPNYRNTSDTDSEMNCLEMTPIKPCHQIMDDIHCYSTNENRVHSNGDIRMKQIHLNSSNNSNNFTSFQKTFLNTNSPKLKRNYTVNFFDELDVADDLVILSNAEESDWSAELTDNERLMEYEDELLDELFIEYNELSGQCVTDSIIYPRNKLKTIGDIPFISKRNPSKYVNNSLNDLSTENNFSIM